MEWQAPPSCLTFQFQMNIIIIIIIIIIALIIISARVSHHFVECKFVFLKYNRISD